MQKVDVLIIGGSAAGLAAAITARRHYPDASIALMCQEDRSVVPCGIPYIYGTLGSPERNLLPDAVLDKNDVELLVDRATDVHLSAKYVSTESGASAHYSRLVLATGSLPQIPPIAGSDLSGVFPIQKNVEHLSSILASAQSARSAVVVGGGFIGLEMADELRKLGVGSVHVVEALPHCLALVTDDDVCGTVEAELSRLGIDVRTSQQAAAFLGRDRVEAVELANGDRLDADIVILGIGSRANVELARRAGLEIGPTGAIAVDAHMRTSDPAVFAAGDNAEKISFFTGEPVRTMLASVATTEARIAAANLFAPRRENPGTIGVFSTKIGDLAMGQAGLGTRGAEQAGIPYVVGEAESITRHPASLPGAGMLHEKLIFRRETGELIGGQAYGADEAGEAVNVISAMIQARMTANQIATFQMGTHPLLTASPVAYQPVNAAEIALAQMMLDQSGPGVHWIPSVAWTRGEAGTT